MISLFLATAAQAESWCAVPLVVHEWGVHVVRVDGAAPATAPIPSWFHSATSPGVAFAPVRDLPPDSGVRALPVVQFWAGPGFGTTDIPVALEVGFRDGSASSWWPAADRRVSAQLAGSVAAAHARTELLAARAARRSAGAWLPLGPDPTKQLGWDRLSLSSAATASTADPEQPWVADLRAVPDALWVTHGQERDRFVYYEATTQERPDVVVERAPDWSPQLRRYVVRNRSDFPVHDLVVVADGRAWTSPGLARAATTAFVLKDPVDRDALVDWMRARWTDAAGPPKQAQWTGDDDCVMMRDPAVPVDRTSGYRLYGPEVDVLLSVWTDSLVGAGEPRVVYREDPAALDVRMPLAVYTDMYHDPQLVRLGLTVVSGGGW